MLTPAMLQETFRAMKDPLRTGEAEEMLRERPAYAESFFQRLGASEVDSLDYSDYEGATIIHDLARQVPAELKGRFSVVYDGGSLEHIFDFPRALQNCMDLVAPGGHLLVTASANNFCGHGFYQPSPEVYFGSLVAANGYRLDRMFAREFGPRVKRWYEVSDPATLGRRLQLLNRRSTFLHVIAKRIDGTDPRTHIPQQDVFEQLWAGHRGVAGRAVLERLRLTRRLRGRYPLWFDREAFRPVRLETIAAHAGEGNGSSLRSSGDDGESPADVRPTRS